MTQFEIPEQPKPSLYAKHVPIFPRRVKGKFRSLKWVIMIITLAIYYITPFLRWDRGPELPDQAVLVDLAGRRFFFFWIEIWPHEFYFVAGLLIMAGLGLFLFTSALGRVWCGYACPQTVWTDLFILTERWIEGDRNARVRLHNAPLSLKKAWLRTVKWSLWLVISLATGGAWVFYFADAPTLFVEIFTGAAPWVAYLTMAILTFTTFTFGGFFREQICIYACPWPRIQAAMMDERTITIGYREWRGEPRGKLRGTGHGDCIDCNSCVNVCPMGIDIRDGQQLACITCGLCIDACDDVMEKVGKPRGLIDYFTLEDEKIERAGGKAKPAYQQILRPRVVLYTFLWAAFGLAMVYALFIRSDISLTVAPVRNPTYVTLSDGAVRNTYEIRLRNQGGAARDFAVSFTGAEGLRLVLEGEDDLTLTAPADETTLLRAYLIAPAGSTLAEGGREDLTLSIEEIAGGARAHAKSYFTGRGQ